jgi:cation transport protein ChaC
VVLRARLDDGRVLNVLVYAVDQSHGQYAGRLSQDEILRLVRQGVGVSGRNPAYVAATHDHLTQIGVKDARLAAIAARLGADEALP